MSLSFDMSFASHRRAKYWSEKNTVSPEDVPLYHQASKYWFKCDNCPHEFQTLPYTIAKINTWCSYCSNKKLCDDLNCIICYNKSFASSDKAQYLSPKNTINPRSVFKSCNKKFIFNCNTCTKEFTATLNNVSGGKWCKSCGFVSMKEKQSMKLDEFLEKSKETHGDIYDYSKVVMNGVDTHVTIICKLHGEFTQTPYKHYSDKNGCNQCGIIRRSEANRFTLDEFIGKANEKHEYKYDYSKVVYINSQTPVIIICKEHGDFSQAPNSHLQGCGCEKCGIKTRSDNQRQTTKEFITKAKEEHGDIYDYSKTNYVSGHKHIIIICKIHGEFTQDPYNHLGGAGCPVCLNKTEANLYKWLKAIYQNTVKEYRAEWCINPKTGRFLRYDFMIPSIMTIIELDGGQHFKQVRNWDTPETAIKKDVFKMQKAKEKGYKIIRILQQDVYKNNDEWLNENLLSEINNPDRTDIFISSIDNIYDDHIKLLENGVSIVLDDSDISDGDNIVEE